MSQHPSTSGAANHSQPFVSIVTPIYNTAEYLAECIESVLRQTHQNWEYILVDNCSTDGSKRIAEQYAARDPRLRLVGNTEFLPVLQNFNSALRHISRDSRYCKMVLADNWLFPECLERMVSLAESHPSVGIVSSYYLMGDRLVGAGLPYSTTVISGSELCRTQLRTPLFLFGSPTTVLYRAEIVRSAAQFFQEQSLHADTDVCYRLLQHWDFGFVHQVLSFMRVDNAGITSTIRPYADSDLAKFLEIWRNAPVYLGAEEAAQLRRNAEREYLKVLAPCVFSRTPKGFWEFHRAGLRTAGYELSWKKLTKWVIFEALDMLGNPKKTLTRLVRKVQRKAQPRIAAALTLDALAAKRSLQDARKH